MAPPQNQNIVIFNLCPQISFGSTSPTLSDRKKFPLFFRTVAPDSSHNRAKIEFVKHFQWKVVAMFCQSDDEFLLPLYNLITEFENENISCVSTITFSLDNYKEQLKSLKSSDIRIIIGSFSGVLFRKVFCEVFRLGMFGEDYVWILQDRGRIRWNSGEDCGGDDFEKAVNGVILVSDYNLITGNGTAVSGINNDLFEAQLDLPKEEISKYAKLAYDAVWAMALSIKHTQTIFEREVFNLELHYKSKDLICELVHHFSSLNFMGISGPVKFIGPDRVGSSVLRQVQDSHVRDIAIFDSDRGKFDFECNTCFPVSWWKGRKPIAQRILKVSLITLPKILCYSIISISSIGILISLLFLYFNLHFRRIKSVKLSSPKLNNVAIVGCICVYISVILLSLDSSVVDGYFNELCSARNYLLCAGLSLAFGSMFAKAYRVHRIFACHGAAPKIKGRLLKDKQLIALILVPATIDAIIFTLWLMVDPMERQLYNLTLQINSRDRGIVYQPQVEICHSHNGIGWFIAIYAYKGLILIMGVFMAWETRHVKVQALNDSQHIGICVYSAVFSAIITILSSFITEHVVFSYLARTLSILTSTTVTLFLLFFPKFKVVFGRHSQDPILQSMGLKLEYNTRRFIMSDPKEQIVRLEIQNKVYRCELEALDLEIERLENQLLSSGDGEIFTISNRLSITDKPPWASWPKTFSRSRDLEFLSEVKLAENLEKIPGFGVVKSVWGNIRMSFGERHKSDPEFYRDVGSKRDLVGSKAKSEIAVFGDSVKY